MKVQPIAPIVKWAGGKRQLIPDITARMPAAYTGYVEPFFGGGAVLFSVLPERAVINDINSELMNVYRVVRDNTDELIAALKQHENTSEYFYAMRALDRDPAYESMSPVEKASRFIYLNKTCYNGLFRVNRSGHFNAPFGRYKNPNIVNEDGLYKVRDYLTAHQVEIQNQDFEVCMHGAKAGDFVYIDPPYDPVSDSSNFTGYAKNGFSRNEQDRLKQAVDALNEKGAYVMLSNSNTPFINDLYADYRIETVNAKRMINSVAQKRGEISEVLVMNYGRSKQKR